jgi:hypothetical protein
MTIASSENKHLILIGDLNYNYMFDESLESNPIHYIEKCYSMQQIITEPTRITPHTSSLIDVLLTTMPHEHRRTKVIPVTMSDHYMISTSVEYKKYTKPHRTIKVRNYTKFNPIRFINDLRNELHVKDLLGLNNVESAWSIIKDSIITVSNKHAPLKTVRVKERSNSWMTPEIIKAMHLPILRLPPSTIISHQWGKK